MSHLQAFSAWLEEQPYRQSTRRKTARDAQGALGAFELRGALPASARDSLRRYALFLQDVPAAQRDGFDRAVLRSVGPSRAMARRDRARKMVAQRFSAEDWQSLTAAVEADKSSPEAAVLLLMLRTGHRVGDFLRLPRAALSRARRTGVLQLERKGGGLLEVPLRGAQDAWNRLDRLWRAAPDDNLALFVCPDGDGSPEAGSCAYKRVARYLQRLGRELSLSGRVHLHRLRRTVAVQALSLSRDVHAVKQLLGHQSMSSTLKYVDELRRGDVEELQQQLRGAR